MSEHNLRGSRYIEESHVEGDCVPTARVTAVPPEGMRSTRKRPGSKRVTPLKKCPGCGHLNLSSSWRISRQPAILNYRFSSSEKAMRVPRRDLRLAQCLRCGLIFNVALDTDAIPYDSNYENRQCFSSVFKEHLHLVADGIITRHPEVQGGRILEVGCGKGDFLKLICGRANASGIGYDTTYEGTGELTGSQISFHCCYVSATDIQERFDAIICRHVIEHVGAIGAFLEELKKIAMAAGNPVVVLETPDFEWSARHGCFWDVFYEHCNYFSRSCLVYLCERAGFEVVRQEVVFDDQYQLLELKLNELFAPEIKPPGAMVQLDTFIRRAEAPLREIEMKLRCHGASNGWAIWGAGAKGVALVNRLNGFRPDFVIDSNAAKAGCFIPASRVPIISPGDPRIQKLSVILIANPIYAEEINRSLTQSGFKNTVLVADACEESAIAGKAITWQPAGI